MRKVKIITDSCSDLTGELLEQYDIDYAKMSTICDGEEKEALLTWTGDDVHAFYDLMRNGKRITTAQVSVAEFERIFKKYLDEDYDIVYIACSSKQSGSVNTGSVTAKRILENYEGASIYCIDSLNACIGEGMLAIEAAKLAKDGKDAKAIAEYIELIKKTVNEYATVHTLDYLKQAGRVTASSAFFGNLMGVKPILIADANGAQVAFKKVKGRQNALKEIVSLLKSSCPDTKKLTVYIAHADCSQEEVDIIKESIMSQIECKDVYVGYIGPIIGASVGPDCIGVWAFGDIVTFAAQ